MRENMKHWTVLVLALSMLCLSVQAEQKPIVAPPNASPSYKYVRYFLDNHTAPRILKNPLDVAVSARPDFRAYMAALGVKIRANWKPPAESTNYQIVAQFTIGRDGSVKKIEIQKSSGKNNLDEAAMAAIRSSSPFAPLPSQFRKPTIDVKYTFDYKVDNKAATPKPNAGKAAGKPASHDK